MARIVNIKAEEYEIYHAFEQGSTPGFKIQGYNVKKEEGKKILLAQLLTFD